MHVVALVCSLNVSSVQLPTHKAISLSVFARLVAATPPRLAFRHSGLDDPCCGPSGAKATPTRSRRAALWSTDITFRFFSGTEAVTTLLRAFPLAGISDLRMRVVPRKLGLSRGAPTTTTALWGMDITFRFFPGTEAVTTLLRAFPLAGISDLRMRVVPRKLGVPRGAQTTTATTSRGGSSERARSFL